MREQAGGVQETDMEADSNLLGWANCQPLETIESEHGTGLYELIMSEACLCHETARDTKTLNVIITCPAMSACITSNKAILTGTSVQTNVKKILLRQIHDMI